MRLPVEARHGPPRVAAGAFILNIGMGKWSVDEETADYSFLAGLVERTGRPCVTRRFPVGLAGC